MLQHFGRLNRDHHGLHDCATFPVAQCYGEARALAFAAIVFGNLALIMVNRSSEKSFITALAQPNPALWWIVLGTLAALAVSLYATPLAAVFRFEPLSVPDLLIALAAGIAGVAVVEVATQVRRRAHVRRAA